MGVDIGTYRSRIGTFHHGSGYDVVLLNLCLNYTGGIKIVGAVTFIGMLLLMAGIESNPGPPKKDCEQGTVMFSFIKNRYPNIYNANHCILSFID